MDIRPLTKTYAVSPQIEAQDMAAIKAAGYTTIICNRPDGEVPPDLRAEAIGTAAAAAGLSFVAIPFAHGALTLDLIAHQDQATAAADGPVLAYCASGNRSSIVWALAQAGLRPTDELIALPARFGYQLESWRGQIDTLAAQRG
jgi:uncharacterized protein (TIGR01244 family)